MKILIKIVLLVSFLLPLSLSADDPFLGEVRIFAGNFAPRGWALCEGQLLSISQNNALFSLLGTYYGGDGRTTFALPDLRGRFVKGQGHGPGLSNINIGHQDGSENIVLNVAQLPSHNHLIMASDTTATTANASGALLATTPSNPVNIQAYTSNTANKVAMHPESISSTGNGAPIPIAPPSLGMVYIIAVQGIYPSRN